MLKINGLVTKLGKVSSDHVFQPSNHVFVKNYNLWKIQWVLVR